MVYFVRDEDGHIVANRVGSGFEPVTKTVPLPVRRVALADL